MPKRRSHLRQLLQNGQVTGLVAFIYLVLLLCTIGIVTISYSLIPLHKPTIATMFKTL